MASSREQEIDEYLKENGEFADTWFQENTNVRNIQNWLSEHPRDYEKIVSSYEPPLKALSIRLPGLGTTIRGKDFKSGMITRPSIKPMDTAKKIQLRKVETADSSLIMELVHDIVQDLDLTTLLHKILQNVIRLLSADVASLFLIDEERNCLVSKVFNVTKTTTIDDIIACPEITVPKGKGIVGVVTDTKETINIADAYDDDRFNKDVDKQTGYTTNTILCMPIVLFDGTVIGAANVVNKSDGVFNQKDEDIFGTYLQFCGIGIRNAQLYELTIRSVDKCEVLLQLAKNIFQEVDIDIILRNIMSYAADLVHAERCSVFMIDKETQELYSQIFDVQSPTRRSRTPKEKKESDIRFPIGKGIAGSVAQTGEKLVIQDAYADPRFNAEVDKQTGFVTRNILCIPVKNTKNEVVGVAMLVNKENGKWWTDDDIESMEAFSIYCGLGIHNAKLYYDTRAILHRNQVALDILSYHATANDIEIKAIENLPRLTVVDVGCDNFHFNTREFDPDSTINIILAMFEDLNLISEFCIPKDNLIRFLITVRKNYRDVLYHNWMHAFSVAQSCYTLIKEGDLKSMLPLIEIMAIFVGCICHDLDHRGTNNAFQTSFKSPLGQLYGTSTMEHHHFDTSITILNRDVHNIFVNLSASVYEDIINLLEHAILSTDLALYFKFRSNFQDLVNDKTFNGADSNHRKLLRSMLMTASDISEITKPWKMQRQMALIVYSEFFMQGDIEKEKGNIPPAMMDRNKKHDLPKMQIGFIDFICMPLYKMLAGFLPQYQILLDGVVKNRNNWDKEAARSDFQTDFSKSIPTANFLKEGDSPEYPSTPSLEDSAIELHDKENNSDMSELDLLRQENKRLKEYIAELESKGNNECFEPPPPNESQVSKACNMM